MIDNLQIEPQNSSKIADEGSPNTCRMVPKDEMISQRDRANISNKLQRRGFTQPRRLTSGQDSDLELDHGIKETLFNESQEEGKK